MNKKIVTIISIIIILLGCFSVCYASNSDNLATLEKQYTVDYKTADDFYNSIEKEITENKVCYELKDIDRVDNFKTLTKEQEIIEEQTTNTNDIQKVINLFNKSKEYEEDEYTGTLKRDNSTLNIKVNNSYQEEYKVYLQKSYDNVSSNELNNIPKTIKENGITYYLVNPVWNVSKTENISDNAVPVTYNGTMYYEGVKTRTIVTSYLATIKYVGTLEKQVPDSTTFTAIYEEKESNNNYTIPVIAGTTGTIIIFFSGIILFSFNNVKIYNSQKGQYKLVKKAHLNKNKRFIDLTPNNDFQTRLYKIVLSKSLYKEIKGKKIRIKYFDKQNDYEIINREFEVII